MSSNVFRELPDHTIGAGSCSHSPRVRGTPYTIYNVGGTIRMLFVPVIHAQKVPVEGDPSSRPRCLFPSPDPLSLHYSVVKEE